MAFLGGLALLGGAAEEYTQTKALQQNQQFKQEMLQLREMQLQSALQRQQKSLQMGADAGAVNSALSGIFGDSSGADPSLPATDQQQPPPAPPMGPGAGMPPGGPQVAGGAPPGMPPPMPPGGQPPQGGPPQAQLAQMPQGQPQLPPGTPPPGPQGGPAFAQQQPQGQPSTPAVPPAQRAAGGSYNVAAEQNLEQFQPPTPGQQRGKARQGIIEQGGQPQPGKLYAQASPAEQRRVAQGGQAQPPQQQQRPPTTPDDLRSRLKASGLPPALQEKAFKEGLKMMQQIQQIQEKKQTAEDLHAMRSYGLEEKKRKDAEAEEKRKEHKDTISGVGEGIISGNTPPDMKGIYKDRAEIEAYLQKHGVSLTQRQLQWQRAQQMVHSISGPQATKFLTLSDTVVQTIDRVKDLSKQVPGLTNYPDFNTWVKEYYERVKDQKTPEAKVANQYFEDLTTLREELAQLVTGGYAPTESAWKQAHDMLKGNWGPAQLEARLDEAQRTINIRRNVMLGMGGAVTSEPNPYLGGGGPRQTQPQQEAPQQEQPTMKPGTLRRFKDGTTRPYKGGDINDPNSYGEPTT
jgi:hypothetical protein